MEAQQVASYTSLFKIITIIIIIIIIIIRGTSVKIPLYMYINTGATGAYTRDYNYNIRHILIPTNY
jgi:hypothetical protein